MLTQWDINWLDSADNQWFPYDDTVLIFHYFTAKSRDYYFITKNVDNKAYYFTAKNRDYYFTSEED